MQFGRALDRKFEKSESLAAALSIFLTRSYLLRMGKFFLVYRCVGMIYCVIEHVTCTIECKDKIKKDGLDSAQGLELCKCKFVLAMH